MLCHRTFAVGIVAEATHSNDVGGWERWRDGYDGVGWWCNSTTTFNTFHWQLTPIRTAAVQLYSGRTATNQQWCNRIDCLLWTLDTGLQTPCSTLLTQCWLQHGYMVFLPFSFLGHISSILEDIWTLNHASSLFVAKQKEINNPSCCIVFLSYCAF